MHAPTITRRRTAAPPLPSADSDEDRERFAALYARHRDELARYCRSILRHDQDVEDALQSTMVKAYAALRTETRAIALRPWLFRIAHNEAISIVRRRVEPVADVEDRDGGDPDPVPRAVETRERLQLLRDDLRDLPERQRSALVLRELSGLGHREIADVLGTSPSAVKQAIYEARCSLGDCAAGRSLTCDRVRRALSDGDGRTAGRRRLRAHLRSCRSCRAFEAALRQRPQDLGAIFPAWSTVGAGGALSGLSGLLSGAGGVAVGTGAGTATVGVGAAGTGAGLLGGGFAALGTAKVAGIAAVAVVAGGGAIAVERGGFGAGPDPAANSPVVRRATPEPSNVRFAVADSGPLVLPAVAAAPGREATRSTTDATPGRPDRRPEPSGRRHAEPPGARTGRQGSAAPAPSEPTARRSAVPAAPLAEGRPGGRSRPDRVPNRRSGQPSGPPSRATRGGPPAPRAPRPTRPDASSGTTASGVAPRPATDSAARGGAAAAPSGRSAAAPPGPADGNAPSPAASDAPRPAAPSSTAKKTTSSAATGDAPPAD